MSISSNYRIKEFDPDVFTKRVGNGEEEGKGLKLVFIGAPGSGKTNAIKATLRAVRSFIPVGIAMSGSEEYTGSFSKVFPSVFVYSAYDEKVLESFEERQKLAIRHLPNPWAVCIVDDCTDTPGIFRKPLQQRFFKNGRQYQMFYILSLQYSLDVPPAIRTSIDFAFIYREPNLKNRRKLWENYASIIPDFSLFCDLMDKLTGQYQCLVIHNTSNTNNIEDCVFYWKAPLVDDSFKFGCPEMWAFHEERCM